MEPVKANNISLDFVETTKRKRELLHYVDPGSASRQPENEVSVEVGTGICHA